MKSADTRLGGSSSRPKVRKGILLAGGSGTRLYTTTLPNSKQLLPIYDKPVVYYPLTTLMLAEIREILVITTARDQIRFVDVLGNGSQWGISLKYATQQEPRGIADALRIGRDFLAGSPCALILGDNIFHCPGLEPMLLAGMQPRPGATIFACRAEDSTRYGVVELDGDGRPLSLTEKPASPRSDYAITGLYFYDSRACTTADELAPSARGELQITDVNLRYLQASALRVAILGTGFAWLDAGTHASFHEAGAYVAALQRRQGRMISRPEEVALAKGWISTEQVGALAEPLHRTDYGRYLRKLSREVS